MLSKAMSSSLGKMQSSKQSCDTVMTGLFLEGFRNPGYVFQELSSIVLIQMQLVIRCLFFKRQNSVYFHEEVTTNHYA